MDNVLGQMSNAFSAGEVRYFWDRGLQQDRLCSCGESFRKCPVWRAVTEDLYGRVNEAEANSRISMRDRIKNKYLILTLFRVGKKWLVRRCTPYADELKKLLYSISKIRGSDVIVDSSKYPSHVFALTLIPDIDLRIIHLVRDPRGVAFSWSTPKYDKGKGGMMRPQGILRASLQWLIFNLLIGRIARSAGVPYLLVRYEDWVDDPQSAMSCIANFIGEEAASRLISPDRTIRIDDIHALSGNPSRFNQGEVRVHFDDRWKSTMKTKEKLLCYAVTWPLALRYRYFLFTS